MKELIQAIQLDLDGMVMPPTVNARINDTQQILKISLWNGIRRYEIRPESYAVLSAKKPDGTALYNVCSIRENEILYAFTAQTTSCAGTIRAELKLYSGAQQLLTSCFFFIAVHSTAFQSSEALQSASEQTALDDLIGRTQDLHNDLRAKLEEGAFNGSSAYEIAVKSGFSGSEAQWLESLRYDHSEEFTQLADRALKAETQSQDAAERAAASAQEAAFSAQNIPGSDRVANAIHRIVTGSSIYVKDISPLVHRLQCRVSSRNLFLLPEDSFSQYGVSFSCTGQQLALKGQCSAASETSVSVGKAFALQPGAYYFSIFSQGSPSSQAGYLIDADSGQELARSGSGFSVPLPCTCQLKLQLTPETAYDSTVSIMVSADRKQVPWAPAIGDLRQITVKRCGENLIPPNPWPSQFQEDGEGGYVSGAAYIYSPEYPLFLESGNYCLHVSIKCPSGGNYRFYLLHQNGHKDISYPMSDGTYKDQLLTTSEKQGPIEKLVLEYGALRHDVHFKGLTLTAGTVPTDSPYHSTSLAVTETGEIPGLVYSSEPMALLPDRAGVQLTMTYNQDLSQVLDGVLQRLSQLESRRSAAPSYLPADKMPDTL